MVSGINSYVTFTTGCHRVCLVVVSVCPFRAGREGWAVDFFRVAPSHGQTLAPFPFKTVLACSLYVVPSIGEAFVRILAVRVTVEHAGVGVLVATVEAG